MKMLRDLPTLHFYTHKETVPSQVVRFNIAFHMSAKQAENGFSEVLHRM